MKLCDAISRAYRCSTPCGLALNKDGWFVYQLSKERGLKSKDGYEPEMIFTGHNAPPIGVTEFGKQISDVLLRSYCGAVVKYFEKGNENVAS